MRNVAKFHKYRSIDRRAVDGQPLNLLLLGILLLLVVTPYSFSAQAKNDLGEQLDSIRLNNDISAAAYAIVSSDMVLAQRGFGNLSHESSTPVSLDSVFRIGSITKTFTALGAVVAESQRKIGLDLPASQFFDNAPFQNAWSSSNPLSIAHLLEHTGGLHDLSKAEFDFNDPVTLSRAFDVDPTSRVLAWRPGMHSSYSNSGAGLVAAVIEKATGRKFEQYMEENVFTPLGLASATFEMPAANAKNFVAGYNTDGRTPISYWHQLYRSFGALNISLRDMTKFVQIFLREDRENLLPALTRKKLGRMLAPRTSLAARNGLTYGYGLGIYQFQVNGFSFFGHGGDADGYLAFFAFSPELNRGYFVVVNAYNNKALRSMRKAIENRLTAERDPRPAPRAIELTKIQQRDLLGVYKELTTRFKGNELGELTIFAEGGDLYTRFNNGAKRQLIPVTATQFRRGDQTIATSALSRDGNALIYQSDVGNFGKQLGQ